MGLPLPICMWQWHLVKKAHRVILVYLIARFLQVYRIHTMLHCPFYMGLTRLFVCVNVTFLPRHGGPASVYPCLWSAGGSTTQNDAVCPLHMGRHCLLVCVSDTYFLLRFRPCKCTSMLMVGRWKLAALCMLSTDLLPYSTSTYN